MWPSFWKPLVIVIPSAAIVVAVLYMTYRFIDPIPPRHFVIAAGMAGSGYDNFARQYARILARDGVELEVRNAAGAVEDLNLLRDGASGVQAALTALGFRAGSSSPPRSHCRTGLQLGPARDTAHSFFARLEGPFGSGRAALEVHRI